MDQAKLAALRAKYGDAAGGDVFNPEFQKISALLFKEGSRKKPYADLSTLCGAPYAPHAAEQADFAGLEVALIGVPMDLGVTNRPGSRFGPRALRNIERIGPYNHGLKVVPVSELKSADVGDVQFRSRYSLEQSIEDIEAYYTRVGKAGVKPLSAGGDHSITYPILKGLAKTLGPIGLVHIDAHCDTSGPYEGCKFHHGGPFRVAVLDGALDPERTIQVGIRGSAEWLWEFSYDSGMTVIHAEDVDAMGVDAVIAKARHVVGDKPFYISIDVDGIDPAFTPGTGTPEVGGLTPREVQKFLRGLTGLNLIGGDVVEVAPQYDTTTNTTLVGASMLFEIFSLIAANKK